MPPHPHKNRKPGRFNDLLGWELLRVSRRIGSLAAGRFLFGSVLLAVMWVLWSAKFSQHEILKGDVTEIQKELSKFAGFFSTTFFMVQLCIALLLTPIYVAGSVFEERETRSGEVLLTTDLTRREIYYGKLLARIFQVLFVIAAGMPILAMTLLWGGVAIEFMVLGYIVTFFSVVSAGAIASAVAADSETMRGAILGTYGYIIVFDGLIFPASPFFVVGIMSNNEGFGYACCSIFFVVQILVTFFSFRYGLRWMRLAMLRQRKRITDQLAADISRRKSPVYEQNPLLWKELNVADHGDTFHEFSRTAKWWLLGYGVLIFVMMLGGAMPPGWITKYASLIGLAGIVAAVGIGAAGSVARERQKNTLIDLFMIPGGRREILQAKLIAALNRGQWPFLMIVCLLVLGIFGGASVLGVPLLILTAVAYTGFAASLGIWFSVRCQSALSATAGWTGTVALFLIATFLFADASSTWVSEEGRQPVATYPIWSRIVNPAMAWTKLGLAPEIDEQRFQILAKQSPSRVDQIAFISSIGSIVLYGAGAIILWKLALRRFENEGREVG